MTERPSFGTQLTSLLSRRSLTAKELAERTGLNAADIRTVLAGRHPTEPHLRRLAPALGLHTVDLFILAGRPVPPDLAPLDAAAARWAARTVTDTAHLPAPARRRLLELTRSLPQEERRSPFVLNPPGPLPDTPGAKAVTMLRHRNLTWTGMARALACVTPTYLSASTYGIIADNRKDLTPRLVTDFAALLAVDPRELALFTDVSLDEVPQPPSPVVADVALLLWEMRRLSAGQARRVCDVGHSLLSSR
ncbi:helix-turn-helix domain-containing protein [Streptomyces sp. NPDC004539]|uniref:helix-turn-helix domain-containing protein n=1 Tax=Streptomyces sp. NPDC004539 TaxID=3154280 RepID=UPI0033AEED42